MTQYPNYASPNFGVPTNPRPTSVTVLAIIGIIWAAILLLCNGFAMIGLVMMQSGLPNPMFDEIRSNTFVWLVQIIVPVVGLINAVALMAGSIGALGLKPWGRSLMVIYAVVAIVIGLLNTVVTIVFLNPVMQRAIANDPNARAVAVGQQVGVYFGIAAVLLYPIFVLVFMNKAHVKAAFTRTALPAVPGYPGGV